MFKQSHLLCHHYLCQWKCTKLLLRRNHSSPLCVGQLDKYSQHKFERTVFGCLDELMLVWCHHQLLFSTHACHTRIKILAYRTRTLFILLLYGFYLYIWRHTSWIWTPEKLLDTKYLFYTNRINNFLRHKQISSRHLHHIVIPYFEFQLLIFSWKLPVDKRYIIWSYNLGRTSFISQW